MVATAARLAVWQHGYVPQLTSSAAAALVNFAPAHNSHANAHREAHKHKVFKVLRRAQQVLCHRHAVGVMLQQHGHAKLRLQNLADIHALYTAKLVCPHGNARIHMPREGNRNALYRALRHAIHKTAQYLPHLGDDTAGAFRRKGLVHTGFDAAAQINHHTGEPDEVDIVGAGDATNAGIVLGLTLGLTPEQAALLGNCVSSLTIQQLGTTGTATPQMVTERLRLHLADL